jgi:hypothetical protein
MTGALPPARTLSCERCGSVFSCTLVGDCWCMDESVRLPLPSAGGDCLCPACLRSAAPAALRPSSDEEKARTSEATD